MNLTSIVQGQTTKENKIALFIVNCILLFPYVIRNFSLVGLLSSLVILILLFAVLFKSDSKIVASAYLPIVIVADVASYIGIHFKALKRGFEARNMRLLFKGLDGLTWIMFAVGIGLVCWAAYANKKKRMWLIGPGGTILIMASVLSMWSNSNVNKLSFYEHGETLFTLAIMGGLLWTLILYFIAVTTPEKRKSVFWISVLLIIVAICFITLEKSYIDRMAATWEDSLLNISNGLFAWWKTVLAMVVLLSGIFVLYIIDSDNDGHLSVDTFALIIAAELICSIRILLSNFFSYNWVLLLIVILGTFRCMKNDYSLWKTLRMNSISYLVLQYLAFVFGVILFKKGLWINVIITVLFGIVFYNEAIQEKKKNYVQSHWIMVVLCVVCEVSAWMWKYRCSFNSFMVIALLFGMSVCTMMIINMRHPSTMNAPNSFRSIICVGLVLLCLLMMSKYGTKIEIQKNPEAKTVNIAIEARGKKNTVVDTRCFWRNRFGRRVSKEFSVNAAESNIEIYDEVLTVITTDAHGIQTTAHYWYPHWLLND